jgi:hypothetical protein
MSHRLWTGDIERPAIVIRPDRRAISLRHTLTDVLAVCLLIVVVMAGAAAALALVTDVVGGWLR